MRIPDHSNENESTDRIASQLKDFPRSSIEPNKRAWLVSLRMETVLASRTSRSAPTRALWAFSSHFDFVPLVTLDDIILLVLVVCFLIGGSGAWDYVVDDEV